MFSQYLKIKARLKEEQDEDKKNILMFDTLKLMLVDNECKNRGYVLTGMPVNEEELQLLYWSNIYLIYS